LTKNGTFSTPEWWLFCSEGQRRPAADIYLPGRSKTQLDHRTWKSAGACEPSLLAVLRCFTSQESRNNILYFLVA
jgi:hypothetical protein